MLAQKYFAQILALRPDIARFITARRRRRRIFTPDAEDEVQEALTEIVRSVPQYRAELGEFRPWAFGIVLNVHRRFIRNHTRQGECFSDQSLNADEHETIDPSPERRLQVSQARDHIENATQAMQPNQYAVLYLFVVEDKSHEEIAKELGISHSASKQLVFRARAYLKQQGIDETTFFSVSPVVVDSFWRDHYHSMVRLGHVASLLAVLTLACPVKPIAFARSWIGHHLPDLPVAAAPSPSIVDEVTSPPAASVSPIVPVKPISRQRQHKSPSAKLDIPAGSVTLLPRKTR